MDGCNNLIKKSVEKNASESLKVEKLCMPKSRKLFWIFSKCLKLDGLKNFFTYPRNCSVSLKVGNLFEMFFEKVKITGLISAGNYNEFFWLAKVNEYSALWWFNI